MSAPSPELAAALASLGQLLGIADTYLDYRGQPQQVSRESQAAILAALGVDTSDLQAVTDAIRQLDVKGWTDMVPPVVVALENARPRIAVSVPLDLEARRIEWTVSPESSPTAAGTVEPPALDAALAAYADRAAWSGSASLEDLTTLAEGTVEDRAYRRVVLDLPPLPQGYHRARLVLDTGLSAGLDVIVAPARCYQPASGLANDAENRGERRSTAGSVWGIAVQLYSLRSADNWGIGDLHDLRELVRMAAPLGCGVIGLNPLHALAPAEPKRSSPYSPSSRQFLNVLYIAVADVPDFVQCEAAQRRVRADDFQTALHRSRMADNVDYAQVASLKLEILRLLYMSFRERHLQRGSERAESFRQFVAARGEPLRLHAIYDALDAHLRRRDPQCRGWPHWPMEYQDPASPAVDRFAREYSQDVEYFMYLQWLVAEQLQAAQDTALKLGMKIGLYGDVAVGADRTGSEVWSNRRLYLQHASVGAPPDALALKGQNWGIPPQDPAELRNQCYQPFIELVRNNMRHVAALRLDHVMSLYRLWWVPSGLTSSEGTYVHYPLDALMAILALESRRNRCVVIGEDLGTVPADVIVAMDEYGVHHYKVLLFEQTSQGEFRLPSQYAANALAAVTTHDLPTLCGWWEEHDLRLRERLDLYPSSQIKAHAHEVRTGERRALMRALVATGLWYWQEDQPLPIYSAALARAVHAFLGMSASAIALIQIEDLIGMIDPVNVPGTDIEHPNWQRKVPLDTCAILARADVQDILGAMQIARSGEHPNDPRFHEREFQERKF
ncbi:hypothetical protein ACG33_14275 [Steroidobacter denitrificans]|uniref:4-alpha-glucanotransferase n=1 Tax=Steroidobacter denitrificans TaxID=465721 RepID=A0A127FCY2_STEDE|nr:4-alpha-glucanotransferase [Steroidobacter denitrificans]AMN48242.1 hypothetical protein ACG33_14275 [Steroidobacter denitrificans]